MTAIRKGTVFSFCGARFRGRLGLKVPPMLSAEVEVLLLGARQNFKLEIDTNDMKKTVLSAAKMMIAPLSVLWKTFSGAGTDKCNITLPEVTLPAKRKLPPSFKSNQTMPSAAFMLKNAAAAEKEAAAKAKIAKIKTDVKKAASKKKMSTATQRRIYSIGYQAGFLPTSNAAKITAEKKAEDETKLSLAAVRSVFEKGYAAGHNDRMAKH